MKERILPQQIVILSLLMVFLVFSSPAAAAPAVELQDGSISRKVLAEAIKKHDADFIAKDKLLAKPLDPNMVVILPKLKVDYSGFLTLTGNQDGWGGCIGRSMVHVMDMLNEMEHPYTPDLSFWYLHVRQDQLANGGPVNTKYLLENYGLAPEAMFPSDYDKAKLVNGQWDYSGMPQPTAAIDQAASLYKVKLLSEPYTPTVKTIKNLLVHYGPILASGPMVKLLGPNPPEGHCVTIVGYDDTTSSFKCLNSWGDYWNGNGFFYLNYNEVAANLTAVRYIEDGPSDRTGTAQAFTARIWLEGQNVSRNKLTVKIGKDGKQPTVVWDTPNEINCIDNSRMLKIDVPMPNYPLSILPAKPWYVEITNSSSGTVVVKELTLARLLKENGVFTTKVTKYPQSGMIIPAKTTVKYYFPTQQLIIKADVNDFPVVLKKNPE